MNEVAVNEVAMNEAAVSDAAVNETTNVQSESALTATAQPEVITTETTAMQSDQSAATEMAADVGAIDGAQALTEMPELSWAAELWSVLEAGGPVVMVLLAMSVVALTLVLSKLIQFQRARLWQRKTARQALNLWQQGEADKALALADNNANPTSQALARAIRGRQRQLPEVAVREEVLRYGSDALFQLRRGFRPLEVIGSLAPLLGLLGTVMGMISAFQQLEAAGNKVNPAILSGGIWEALLTTAVGLCVAIPVVALLNWLERCVDHLAHEMDNLVMQVFTEDLSAASELTRPTEQVDNAADNTSTNTVNNDATSARNNAYGADSDKNQTRNTTNTAHAASI